MALEFVSIVLAVVSIVVTTIGFFASLRFYRDGTDMQNAARAALSTIQERAAAIQTQVGGLFDKTLNAALGLTNPAEAERQQKALQASLSPPASDHEGGEPVVAGAPLAQLDTEPAKTVIRYFTFKQMRLTDVSEGAARALFGLGISGGFNLWDGSPDIVFFGFFHTLEPVEIVARVRMLFSNLEIAYKRISENPDTPEAEAARQVLGRISVEVLVPEDVDLKRLKAKIDEFQPSARRISVVLHTATQLTKLIEEEYRRMRI